MSTIPSAVLFACTYNAIRSPMALSIFRKLYGDKAYVESVGVEAGHANGFVSVVLEEGGYPPLDNHRPKTFDDLHDDNFEVIVALSKAAHDRALEETRTTSCEVLYWPIEDPSATEGNREAQLEAYRKVRDEIRDHVLQEWEPASPEKSVRPRKGPTKLVKQRGHVLWHRMRNSFKKLRG